MEFEARLIVEVDFRRAGAAAEHKGDKEYGQAHRIISICQERSAASKTVSPGHHDHAVIRYGKSRGVFSEVESDALTVGYYNILVYDAALQVRAGTHPDPIEEDGIVYHRFVADMDLGEQYRVLYAAAVDNDAARHD